MTYFIYDLCTRMRTTCIFLMLFVMNVCFRFYFACDDDKNKIRFKANKFPIRSIDRVTAFTFIQTHNPLSLFVCFVASCVTWRHSVPERVRREHRKICGNSMWFPFMFSFALVRSSFAVALPKHSMQNTCRRYSNVFVLN